MDEVTQGRGIGHRLDHRKSGNPGNRRSLLIARIKYSRAMYLLRTPNCPKRNLKKRWALPDRVFFACGACHILAHAFTETFASADTQAVWIKPDEGHTGNHVFVSFGDTVFDYHGYAGKDRYLAHYWKRARHLFPTWDAELVEITSEALTTEGPSEAYNGLWLRAPHQFFKNPIPRAEAYLARFPHPSSISAH